MSVAGVPVGTVRALSRYPVKSIAGEELSAAEVTTRGLRHDRGWAAYCDDGGIASGKSTRRFRRVPGLMGWTSRVEADDDLPILISPEGITYRADDPAASAALTEAFGRRLALRPESTVQHHDESPIHLVTTSSIATVEGLVGGTVDHRRFRANIVIDTGPESGYVEDGWAGAKLAVGGEVILHLGPRMPRCVMVDHAQDGVAEGPRILRSLGMHHDTMLGLQARPHRTGTISVGDVVVLHASLTV